MQQGDGNTNELDRAETRQGVYPTPETAHSQPRTIYPRSHPEPPRPYSFGSAESPISPAHGDRPHLNQPLRPEDRRPAHYNPDEPPALYPTQHGDYSNLNSWGTFSSPTAKPQTMATAHGGVGPQAAPYHTPQSNSPVSVASPHDQHIRQMYPPNVHHPSHMYYNTYAPQPHHQSQYGYGGPMQPPLQPHSPQYQVPSYHQQPHHYSQPPHPAHHSSFDSNAPPKLMQIPMQSPGSHIGSSQLPNSGRQLSSPQATTSVSSQSAAAPGPIRATTPVVVKQDTNGVTTISFEYSKDRVKQPYEIRCDVDSVDVKSLPQEHKNENCVYPRACSGEPYKGNRFQYENECNEVAWALAYLNPELKGKRGLIQRAVDSWRNSNKDRKLRSRRVRRMAKTEKRAHTQQQQIAGRPPYAPPTPTSSMVPGSMMGSTGLGHPPISASMPLPPYHGHTGHPGTGHPSGDMGGPSTS